jgi:hypothetical protein
MARLSLAKWNCRLGGDTLGRRRMTPDYRTMLRTAAEVQSAATAAWLELASRSSRFLMSGIETFVRSAAQPLRVSPEQRQSSIEDAVWTAYAAHEELLRAMTGVPRLAILIFLNELDLRRGTLARPAEEGE